MAADGRRNQDVIPLGSSIGPISIAPEDSQNPPYPVIIATRETATSFEIDIDWKVRGALVSVSGFEPSDIRVTGTAQNIQVTVVGRAM